MSVEDLSEVLEDANTAEGAQFIDVREPHEEEIASLPRFHLLPLSRCVGCLHGINLMYLCDCQERVTAALPPDAAEPVSGLLGWQSFIFFTSCPPAAGCGRAAWVAVTIDC